MTRTLLIVVLALLAIAAPAIIDRTEPDQLGSARRVHTTTDPVPPTTWLETQPDLGHRFNEYRAGVARAQAARVKRKPVLISANGSVWDRLAECESHQDWSYNGPSGFDGGLQFHPGTWSAYRPADFPAYAYEATRVQQILVAERVLADQGWAAWPYCSRRLGLR